MTWRKGNKQQQMLSTSVMFKEDSIAFNFKFCFWTGEFKSQESGNGKKDEWTICLLATSQEKYPFKQMKKWSFPPKMDEILLRSFKNGFKLYLFMKLKEGAGEGERENTITLTHNILFLHTKTAKFPKIFHTTNTHMHIISFCFIPKRPKLPKTWPILFVLQR